MGLFSSASKPPSLAPMPTCQALIFHKENQEMLQITRVANQVTTEMFNALSSARALEKNKSLSSSQRSQVSEAIELLKEQGTLAKYTTQELTCFNKTYDQWGNELAQKHERQGVDGRALLNDSNLRTKDGFTPAGVRTNVDHHRTLLSGMAGEGVQIVASAVQTLNNIADSKGAPRIPDVSATWAKAANPASW